MHFPSTSAAGCLASLLALAPFVAGEPVPNQDHEIAQRSIEAGTWALETRGLLDDLGTCNGCQVS